MRSPNLKEYDQYSEIICVFFAVKEIRDFLGIILLSSCALQGLLKVAKMGLSLCSSLQVFRIVRTVFGFERGR